MEPRRTSVRRAGLVGIALALIVGASACSSDSSRPLGKAPAATVNGVAIPQSDVTDLVSANIRFYKQAKGLGQDPTGELAKLADDATGTGSATQSMTESVSALNALITSQLMRGFLSKHKALPTKADLTTERTSLETSVGGAEKLAKFDKQFIDFAVESRALTTAYRKYLAAQIDKKAVTLTPAQRETKMKALFQTAAPTLPLCLNAIQSQTEAESAAARKRVDGGEDFGAVAKDLAPAGVTVADGGFGACLSYADAKTAFGTDFTGAQVGDLYGPVPYSSGQQGAAPTYFVLQVDGLKGPTYEQLLPQLEQAVPEKPAATDPTQIDVSAPLALLSAKADVTVDPMYGSWDAKSGSVVAPKVPAPVTPAEKAKAAADAKAAAAAEAKAAAAAASATTVPAAAGS